MGIKHFFGIGLIFVSSVDTPSSYPGGLRALLLKMATMYKLLASVFICAGLLVGVSGCGKRDEGDLAKRVTEQLAAGKIKDATVELRSYLQDNPKSAHARFLLGQALARTGLWAEAEREFERALERGHPDGEVLPALIEIKLQQERAEEVIQSYALREIADPAAAQKVRALLVQAYLMKADRAGAERVLTEALQVEAGNPSLLVLGTRLAAAKGGDAAALREQAKSLAQRFPDHVDTQTLLGDALGTTDRVAAIAAYEKALALQPKSVHVYTALIGQYLSTGAVAQAREQAERFYKALPGNWQAFYYQGVTAFAAGDYRMAREWLQALLRGGAQHAKVLLLAGATEMHLGNLAQAEVHLSKAAGAAPDAVAPRYYQAMLQLRQGQPARALAVLQPVLSGRGQVPADVWTVAARAYTLTGDFKRADEAFQQVRAAQPEGSKGRADYAHSLMMRGEMESGLRELRDASATKDTVEADLALAAALVARKDIDGALKVLDAAGEKRPNTPLVDLQRARALEARGDKGGAARAYELALRKDARFLPAIERLAQNEVRSGQPQVAEQRYRALLARDPRSVHAMLALAGIGRAAGRSEAQTSGWLDKAVTASPRDAQVWLAAISHQARRGDDAATLSWAQRAAAAMPEDPDITARLAAAQLAAGETEQAVTTTSRLTGSRPNVASYRLQAAQTLVAAKRYSAARSHVVRALELEPESFLAHRANSMLYIQEGKPQQALQTAQVQQAKHPKSPLAWWLVAEVHERRDESAAAVVAGRKALALAPTTENALRLQDLLARQGVLAEATAFSESWIKDHPQDAGFIGNAALMAERSSDPARAQALHRKAVELNPSSPVTLNNLAFFLVRAKDPQGLELARRAVQLGPDVATFRDTLSRALELAGQNGPALQEELRAVELAPRVNEFRLELARLYIATGDKSKAKKELVRLSDQGSKFHRQDEVQKLLQDAGG
jgi:cellulose synthase operon protein C